jgi:hypothetical protein
VLEQTVGQLSGNRRTIGAGPALAPAFLPTVARRCSGAIGGFLPMYGQYRRSVSLDVRE